MKCWWGNCENSALHNVRYPDNSVAFFCDEHYDLMEQMWLLGVGHRFIKGRLHGQAYKVENPFMGKSVVGTNSQSWFDGDEHDG